MLFRWETGHYLFHSELLACWNLLPIITHQTSTELFLPIRFAVRLLLRVFCAAPFDGSSHTLHRGQLGQRPAPCIGCPLITGQLVQGRHHIVQPSASTPFFHHFGCTHMLQAEFFETRYQGDQLTFSERKNWVPPAGSAQVCNGWNTLPSLHPLRTLEKHITSNSAMYQTPSQDASQPTVRRAARYWGLEIPATSAVKNWRILKLLAGLPSLHIQRSCFLYFSPGFSFFLLGSGSWDSDCWPHQPRPLPFPRPPFLDFPFVSWGHSDQPDPFPRPPRPLPAPGEYHCSGCDTFRASLACFRACSTSCGPAAEVSSSGSNSNCRAAVQFPSNRDWWRLMKRAANRSPTWSRAPSLRASMHELRWCISRTWAFMLPCSPCLTPSRSPLSSSDPAVLWHVPPTIGGRCPGAPSLSSARVAPSSNPLSCSTTPPKLRWSWDRSSSSGHCHSRSSGWSPALQDPSSSFSSDLLSSPPGRGLTSGSSYPSSSFSSSFLHQRLVVATSPTQCWGPSFWLFLFLLGCAQLSPELLLLPDSEAEPASFL